MIVSLYIIILPFAKRANTNTSYDMSIHGYVSEIAEGGQGGKIKQGVVGSGDSIIR